MNDEPFLYKEGVVVPRDVTRLIIDGSVTVVQAGKFRDYFHLLWVEIREGVQAIGAGAFSGCSNLERVDFPSSLRTIGERAFEWCSRRLPRVNLPEGLRIIKMYAFWGHSFEEITLPSSVVEVGTGAFAKGKILNKVTFVGGVAMLEGKAFDCCRKLRNIATPSKAIVVEDGRYGNGRAVVRTGGTIRHLNGNEVEPDRLILTSPYLAWMNSEDVKRAKDEINRTIEGRRPGGHPLVDQCLDADRIRACFLGLLSARRGGVASVLGRALEPDVARIVLSFLPDVEG